MTATLEGWLQRIEGLHPSTIDLGLQRVRRVHGVMGLPRKASPVVIVSGTNGKGSCIAWLESMLRASGLRTGVYTSPHLRHYNERIRVAGAVADDDSIVRSFERVEAARADVSLTYFEFGTLAALALFDDVSVDIRVLEVGLGGRLDAVNVVDADVAIITSVGLDHQSWLGSDREAIGREKAGIFRAGAPAIVGERDIPSSVADVADTCGARLLKIGTDFDFSLTDNDVWHWNGCVSTFSDLPRPAFGGNEQYTNASCALAAMEQLALYLPFRREHLVSALSETRVSGRCQILELGCTWLLDVAHNAEAARTLAAFMQTNPVAGRTFVVAGLMKDKPVEDFAAALDAVADEWWAVDTPEERGLTGSECAERLQAGTNAPIHVAPAPLAGLAAAAGAAGSRDRIVVTGSFSIVGAALDYLTQH